VFQHIVGDVFALRGLTAGQDALQPRTIEMQAFKVRVRKVHHLCNERIEPQEGGKHLPEFFLLLFIQHLVETLDGMPDNSLQHRPFVGALTCPQKPGHETRNFFFAQDAEGDKAVAQAVDLVWI
jgi:hypothetical protein